MIRALLILTLAAATAIALPITAAGSAQQRPQDIADAVAGTYFGDVISDARGSSRSGVTVTVTRVGPNLVEVSSDYARVPTVRIPLTRAMNAVVQERGDHVFLINGDSDPNALSLTIDDASLSVRRR